MNNLQTNELALKAVALNAVEVGILFARISLY